MKKVSYVFLSSLAMAAAFSISACGGNGGSTPVTPTDDFNFSLLFESGRSGKLYKNEAETLSVYEVNSGSTQREYTFTLTGNNASDYVEVTKNADGKSFTVTPKEVTPVDPETKVAAKVGIRITEKTSNRRKTEFFTIGERYSTANTGYNFSSDTEAKANILGELEKYAMSNYLTGITLFENGGFVRYSSRVKLPTESYVTGYGFGLLTEGSLDNSEWTPEVSGYVDYLRTATSSDPGNINGWEATGSQISDLFGYITSSFWGTKLNAARDGYEWYPVLAKENDPEPLDGEEGVTIHKKWRVYVKTGNIAYRTVTGGEFDNRAVTLDDYLFTFQLLLTQKAGLTRGAELATDTSYGFKGAYSYFRNTKDATPEQAEAAWTDMVNKNQLGIVGGHDDKGDYIDFEFVNPIDQFTAKYTLSSNLYSPLPKDFLKKIGGGNWISGGEVFGTKNGTTVMDNVLCLGPFYLREWNTDKEIVFTRNDNWFEYVDSRDTDRPRYNIPGVHMLVVTAATQQDDAIFNQFNRGLLDSTGIPVSRMKDKLPTDLPTKGDSTFKLNVNSCTQERWDELFWSNKYPDIKKPTSRYMVKPWMSNKNFLNGLFWSINRNEFATNRGVNPSYNYFADAYLSDPIEGISYNSTDAHKAAEDGFDESLRTSNYGYSKSKATSYFNLAVNELVKAGQLTLGTKSNKAKITIDIQWMYQNDETTYGQDIANYFKDAFNTDEVGDGRVELVVNHNADPNWEQVYNDHLMVGKFDLGFGAISGNTLNPLNFMEVLKSDNSSGFTLNWGADTSKVDPDNPIVFEVTENGDKVKKEWSFDAIWAAADHGAVIKDGEVVDSVKLGYTTAPTAGGSQVNKLASGGIMEVPFEFVEVDEGVTFNITRVQLFLVGYGYIAIDEANIEYLYKEDGVTIRALRITFDNTEAKYEDEGENYTLSQYVNKMLFDALKLQKSIDALDVTDPKYEEKVDILRNPFSYDLYDAYWGIEVYYNITIKGSVPTENSYYVEETNTKDNSSRFSLAR